MSCRLPRAGRIPYLSSYLSCCRSRVARAAIHGAWLLVVLAAPALAAEPKTILMVAGKPSHGFGSHEHYAGLKVLQETLSKSMPDLRISVVRGWPEDPQMIADADSIVIFSDGGGGHPALPHLSPLAAKLDQGCGFVCLHYAVEVPKGEPGQHWLKYLGGYFETDWSVNPHWTADFQRLPEHPITRGVSPFATNDEWYFHMRFTDPPQGMTPILQAVAPEETMRRPDGPHSGNPHVRKSVAKGEPQTVAWAYERPGGGRSFGYTGGHFHWNWGNPDVRKLVANAILWTAGGEVPAGGIGAQRLGIQRLLEDQDYPKPDDFDAEETAKRFQLGASVPPKGAMRLSGVAGGKTSAPPRPLWQSPQMTSATPGQAVEAEVDIRGVRDLFLVVNDGGDSYACDWADWVDPVLVGDRGERSLLELPWVAAKAGFGEVRKNANAVGEKPTVAGKPVTRPMIGTHANSVIHYQIPEGFRSLRLTAALDDGGVKQNGGASTSVRFAVYADAAPREGDSQPGGLAAIRAPENAVSGLEIAADVEVKLAASEPDVRNLTNLDIDDRGRVWVCEVMNYRQHAGSRPEGDRILILEDTDSDGVMDTQKVFYQGADIDSAMGICVLDNEVIVSAAPYVWKLIDDNRDDVADRKVAMFTQTGQPQHDHSNHSFVFGPDGKLYWNFGNTGLRVKDAQGNPVIDIHGREIVDNGKPFWGGMVFRCDLDGGRMEVLAHNFRNNWETAVDSFGTLWQSDNDDDGNRGTRINFVMEYGNYGYRDELTGANWQADRINSESEIPLRHWHLNDPGVVPNLLQTGAGSPCGMLVYEGRLLPARFHDQMIHCDPGPNAVRAYPVRPSGAGYSASIEPLMTGREDKWFRPADVCAAPDGSLFVTDWYDPGVGGHRQEDTERGRLFRIAPPNSKYQIPKFDYQTPQGAVLALQSPAMSVRYKAWMALHRMGADAEPTLLDLYRDADPRLRARALWLLGKIEGRGEHYVDLALADNDENIRVTAIRLLRQLGLTPSQKLSKVDSDPSAAVRREALVALRYDRDPAMPALWARLAKSYDGQDRWYLEALGIASDLRPTECFEALRAAVGGQFDQAPYQGVIWRLRAPEAAAELVRMIGDPKADLASTDPLFRALDFHTPDSRGPLLRSAFLTKGFAESAGDAEMRARNDAIIVRSLERVGSDGSDQPAEVRQALTRYIDGLRGSPQFLKLVARYRADGFRDEVMKMALADDDSAGVEALRMLLADNANGKSLAGLLASADAPGAPRLAARLGQLGNPPAIKLLTDTVAQEAVPYPVRSAAVRGLASSKLGAKALLQAAQRGALTPDTRLLAGGLLNRSDQSDIRETAAKLFPQPLQGDSKPLPALDQLVAMPGDASRGAELFRTKATCANCHLVGGQGKQVGPDLSEIGDKLSPEAMFTSILDPSAGISHNYETYLALLDSGQLVTGLLVNQTDDAVTIRTPEAIDRTIPRGEIVELKKGEKSIMPEGLHQTIEAQGLVDIIQYMRTLKRKG